MEGRAERGARGAGRGVGGAGRVLLPGRGRAGCPHSGSSPRRRAGPTGPPETRPFAAGAGLGSPRSRPGVAEAGGGQAGGGRGVPARLAGGGRGRTMAGSGAPRFVQRAAQTAASSGRHGDGPRRLRAPRGLHAGPRAALWGGGSRPRR